MNNIEGQISRGSGLGAFSAESYLGVVATDAGLKKKAVRGSATTIVTNTVGLFMQVVSTAVLARLVGPTDTGLVVGVYVFALLLSNIGINGITEAIIQRRDITQEQLSCLFWISVGIGLFLTGGFMLAAGPMAAFYHEPQLKHVTLVLSLTIIATNLGTVHLALLKRNMEFRVLNVNALIARGASAVLSILAAWRGYRYWALIVGYLALPMTTTIWAWLYCNWRPGLYHRRAEIRSMIQFAIHTFGYFFTNYVGRNLDKVLMGVYWGADLLGNYKKAYDLFFLPIGLIPAPLTNVALASLAPLRSEPEKYRRYYLKSVAVMAFMGMALGGAMTITGSDFIRILLGPKWDDAQRVFTWFAPGMGIIMIYSTNGWLHLSLGRADRWFKWGIVEMAVACLFTVAGLHFGGEGLAAATNCSFLVLMGPALAYAGRPIDLRFSAILSAIWMYVFAALIAGVVSWLPFHMIGAATIFSTFGGRFLRLILMGSLFSLVYMGVLALFPFEKAFGPIQDVSRMLCPKWLQAKQPLKWFFERQ